MSTFTTRAHGYAWRFAATLSLLAFASGCPEEETNQKPVTKDGISKLQPGWNTIAPGGDTVCARGAPFRYFVRPGKVNKLLIDFRGGGACWNEKTCSASPPVFDQ